AEFCHKDVPAAWLAARRAGALLVADPLVSRTDTMVGDWALHPAASLEAWADRCWDRATFAWPHIVVADTQEHARHFAAIAGRSPFPVVPVGAAQVFFDLPDEEPAPRPLRALYAGGFLPFHGVDVIVDAAVLLERRGVTDVAIELVGDGITAAREGGRARQLGLSLLRFTGRRPLEELPARLLGCHVALGVFAPTPKAGRVIPHKVVQGLAAGRCVVTADTPAAR